MKYGKIGQLQNIRRWLKNFQETGYMLYDATSSASDRYFREQERKMRAENFNPFESVGHLIEELEHIINDYLNGMSIEIIQSEWDAMRPELTRIFNEEKVLPEIIVEQIPFKE